MVNNAHYRQQTEATESRRFDPSTLYSKNVDLDRVEVRKYNKNWTYVACEDSHPCAHCNCIAPHLNSIVIAVDGACRRNGTTEAVAAAGVFVGEESQYNKSVVLEGPRATNQVAELSAGILALQQAMEIQSKWSGDEPLQQVVIKADSQYLVKGMTEWVFKWKENGYRTSKGTQVTNSALFEELQGLIGQLNERGIEVLFWHVPRNWNKEADELAGKALRI